MLNYALRGVYMFLKREKILAIIIFIYALLFSGCNSPKTDFEKSLGSHGLIALESFLENSPTRTASSTGEKNAAKYIAAQLNDLSLNVKSLPFEYDTPWKTGMKSENLYVTLSAEPNKNVPTILLGAHYDNVELGQGADDNASGVASLLTLATYFSRFPTHNVNIEFVFFGSEEVGLKGSQAFANLIESGDLPRPDLMINFDSLIAGDYTYVYGSTDGLDPLKTFLEVASKTPYSLMTQDEPMSGLSYGSTLDASDHAPFKALGIPYLYFEATNWTIGNHDGYTQTSNAQVENGEIWHTEKDRLEVIESIFPNRPKEHLQAFLFTLVAFLKQYSI